MGLYQERPSAWLTFVTLSEHVPFALILARSIRNTFSTKKLAVIVKAGIPSIDKVFLRKAFDHVFFLNEESGTNSDRITDMYVKAHAWSLEMFEKCIFLRPQAVMLHNGDRIFDDHGLLISLDNNQDMDLTEQQYDNFLLSPSAAFSDYLKVQISATGNLPRNSFSRFLECYTRDGNKDDPIFDYLNTDQENGLQTDFVMKLSLTSGKILEIELWNLPPIIQFMDGPKDKDHFADILRELSQSGEVGTTEKAVFKIWLGIFEEEISYTVEREINFPNNISEPIAIIGMACRLPGANNLDEFWNLLYSGKEGGCKLPSFRWRKGQCILRVGESERETYAGFLKTTVDEFDNKFFGISPKEAEFMDPQTRILHEVMWESLENAGVDPTTLHGSQAGVFSGSWLNDYKEIVHLSNSREFLRTYMGNSIGAGAAKLSHFLGLTGQCVATESGCSSAMVAVDLAIKSLRLKQTSMAIVGGVNLLLHPFTTDIMDYVIAQDGRCKTFDAKADGFGRAEGCCFLVLKRLSDAKINMDNIWAIIRGSGVSQEGISRSLGTPTVHCEALAMKLALKNAGVRPEMVSFVETHGTGTPVGDPMEVAAIAKAYHSKNRKGPLIIGSVKTNVGHTESCSGLTGIIKTVLALHHELIPKHLNMETLNPDINLEAVPALIPLEAIAWPKMKGQPRIAGVSSFGITGTDGHVILQEPPAAKPQKLNVGMERPLHILKVSAKTNEAMDALLKSYEKRLVDSQNEDNFMDFAYTANIGRASFDNRAFLLASNFGDGIRTIQEGKLVQGTMADGTGKICFLFTGQGSQYPGMAKTMYDTSPVFRHHFDHCKQILQETYNLSICQTLWGSESETKKLKRTIFSQLAIFCVEYCLLQLWKSWGIRADYVLGHSLGEFVAAVAAGILSLKDALKLVAVRSKLIDSLPTGSMLAIKANQKQVEEFIRTANTTLDFAAANSAEQTVVAGDTPQISQLASFCMNNEIKCVILEATHAFHSSHMDSILETYRKTAESITYNKTAVQYISGMEGTIVLEMNADYWVRHTREKVNFQKACKTLRQLDCHQFVELGPHPVLSSFVMQNIQDIPITCYPSLRRNFGDWETILTSLGKLWIDGIKVDWMGFDKPYQRKKLPSLPLYPFQRKSFWVECSNPVAVPIHPLLGAKLSNASNVSIFQNDLNINTVPYLKDHCIGSRIIFPGAAFTEMCLSAGYAVSNFIKDTMTKPSGAVAIENVSIQAPLEVQEGIICRMQAVVDIPPSSSADSIGVGENFDGSNTRNGLRCKIFHRNNSDNEVTTTSGEWMHHSTGTFYPVVGKVADILQNWSGNRIKEMISSMEASDIDMWYKRLEKVGLKFGDSFRCIQKRWSCQQVGVRDRVDEVVAEMKIPPDFDKYLIHPLIIDAMFQAQIIAGIRNSKVEALRVPVHVGKLTRFNTLSNEVDCKTTQPILYLHAKWSEKEQYSVLVTNSNFSPLALIENVDFLETNVKTIQSLLEQQKREIPDCWQEVWNIIPGSEDKRLKMMDMNTVTSDKEFLERIEAADKTTSNDEQNARKIELLVCMYTLRTFYQLGWKPSYLEELTAEGFCAKYNVLAMYHQLVHFYFNMFHEVLGMLEQVSDCCSKKIIWRLTSVPFKTEDELTVKANDLYSQLVKEERVSVVVKFNHNLAGHLAQVLTGETSALSILFPTDADMQEISAENYYQKHPARRDVAEMTRGAWSYISESIHEFNGGETSNKIFRVLEVGAGTGSASAVGLDILTKTFGAQFEYYYTDISASFFAKAEKRFEAFRGNLKFGAFNVEECPLGQGIPVNYFDFLLASDVLHTTRNLRETLRNLRMTLRPKGILSFTETFTQDKCITFAFGLLDGYWRFEDFATRPHHTCINAKNWKKLLLEGGFSYVHSCEAYLGQMGCITAEASTLSGYDEAGILTARISENKKKRWIIFSPKKETDSLLKVAKVLEAGGNKVEIVFPSVEMETEEDEKTASIYSVLRGDNGYGGNQNDTVGIIYAWALRNGEHEQKTLTLPFMHIAKHVLGQNKSPRLYVLLQDVLHVVTEDVKNPWAATLLGMAKSLKNENPDLVLRCIDIEGTSEQDTLVNHILFEMALHKEIRDKERMLVAYRNGCRYEPRLNRVSPRELSKIDSDLPLPLSTSRYHLSLPKSRMINDLTFVAKEEEKLDDDEVEVRTHAYALNFRDILTILKPIKEFEDVNAVGIDFAGIVAKTGKDVDPEKIRVGDRVFGMNLRDNVKLPSHINCKAENLARIPDSMTFAEASTLTTVYATSIYCLINTANLKKDETVLIHTGSGGVGISAIQIAKRIGSSIITTAGSPRKRAYLRSLGIQHVFHSRNTSYKEDILRVTNGRGVDVVLNSLTGPGFKEATLDVCAKNARFVEMSKLSVWTEDEVNSRRPDVKYYFVDLTKLIDSRMLTELQEKTTEALERGECFPIPFVQFDALRIRQALQHFQRAKHIGKIVVTMPDVKTDNGVRKIYVKLFNSSSTYLITGGMGGIGFEVCKWMLEKGATDNVLIGRNPPKDDVAVKINQLNKINGNNVMVKLADVGDYDQCKSLIDELGGRSYKPIRGLHHCAGVLMDNLYHNQTWQSFDLAFNPKVNGSWNLHRLLQGINLEHFVLYSSFTSLLGSAGQANHAAANTFEDALAHYRYSLGLTATTINWGQWAQVGCAKEINIPVILPVSVARMLNGLEEALRSQRLQSAFLEFESLSMWNTIHPNFKYYLDERLLKSLNDSTEKGSQATMLQSAKFWEKVDAAETVQLKMGVVMEYMKVILRTGLRMEPDEPIKEDANIQDLGVDSLMFIEFRNVFQGLLGSRLTITASMLKDCNTVRQLANAIVSKIVNTEEPDFVNIPPLSPEELEHLLNEDCILDETIQPENPYVITAAKVIFITGVTGQLGPYILSRLSKMSTVVKVICLIRSKEEISPQDRLLLVLKSMDLTEEVDMNKVECVLGDVILSNFGLEQDKYDQLCETVDEVIHLAVKNNHVEPYRKFETDTTDGRSVCVGGTLSVLKFVVAHKTKCVYYASTILTVFGNETEGTLSEDWPKLEHVKIIAENAVMAYPANKFVCEILLKQANDRGIPCKVFRFPWIMGESKSGRLNFQNNQYMLRFLAYLKLRAMPDAPLPALVIPVDICADWSLKLFHNDQASWKVYNIAHPEPQLEVEFVRVAKENFGTDIELVEWNLEKTNENFIERLYATGMPMESLREIFEDVDRISRVTTSKAFRAIQGYLNFPDTFFKNKTLEMFIPEFDRHLPSTTDIIRINLEYARSMGYFSRFGLDSE